MIRKSEANRAIVGISHNFIMSWPTQFFVRKTKITNIEIKSARINGGNRSYV